MTKLDKGGLNMGTPFLLGQEPQIQVKMQKWRLECELEMYESKNVGLQ